MPEASHQTTTTNPAGVQAGQPDAGKLPIAASANPSDASDREGRSKIEQGLEHYKGLYLETSRKLETIEKNQKAAEEKRLAESGEYRTLAEQKTKEAESLRELFANERRTNALMMAGHAKGIRDASDLYALADLGAVDVTDGDALSKAAQTAVDSLFTSKPYLFASATETPTTKPHAARTSAASATPGGPSLDYTKVTKKDIQEMSTDTFRKYWDNYGKSQLSAKNGRG